MLSSEKITFYKCFYCSKTYKKKENYKNHITECELYNKMLSSADITPNQHDMYKLVKLLAFKCNKLEKELTYLKGIVNVRKKKEILEWLNSERKHNTSFTEFYKNITIEEDDLKIVFENNLIRGLCKLIIKSLNKITDKPIFCCSQKHNYLYIYDYLEEKNEVDKNYKRELNWKIGNNKDFEIMITCLNGYFLQEFLEWKNRNKEQFSMTEEGIHLEMMYMSRILGFKLPLEKIVIDVKKELYKELQENVSGNCD